MHAQKDPNEKMLDILHFYSTLKCFFGQLILQTEKNKIKGLKILNQRCIQSWYHYIYIHLQQACASYKAQEIDGLATH
jgi:hypothetical protein